MTHDVDLVVSLAPADADRLEAAFPARELYCPPADVMRIEARRRRRGHFNLIHHATGFKADIYLQAAGDPLHAWAFAHRRRVGTDAVGFWLAPPEYVIVRKLQFFQEGGSDKHLRDIRAMVATLGADSFDHERLAQWVADLGLDRSWERVTGAGS